MTPLSDQVVSRRDFLRLAASLGGVLLAASAVPLVPGAWSSPGPTRSIPRLNPAFRLRELDGGGLEVFTHVSPGSRISHQFTGLEADCLRELAAEKPLAAYVEGVAARQGLSPAAGQGAIIGMLDEFSTAGLVYFGDTRMIVAWSENRYEQ
jgi:hypothetical protein